MAEPITTWAGDPLGPTTFDRCLQLHFIRKLASDKRTRHIWVDEYRRNETSHGPLLASLGIARFQYLGIGGAGFVMQARSIDNKPLAIKLTRGNIIRPRHPRIVPAYFKMERPRTGAHGLEILPLVDTADMKARDVLDVAIGLASTGMWVEDLHEENIGRHNGQTAVFDVSSGVCNYRKEPERFYAGIRTFLLRRWGHKHRKAVAYLRDIADGEITPMRRPRKPERTSLALPMLPVIR